MKIAILGLSITSSWGNGHATTYRSLVRALANRGHEVVFLECDRPWYAHNRDLPRPPYCAVTLYDNPGELRDHAEAVADAELVILGSYVPDGSAVADWLFSVATGVTAFYDIDTPVTLGMLSSGECGYLHPAHVPKFDYYFSFTGGDALQRLEQEFGAQRARPLYCSVDTDLYYPDPIEPVWDLGYLGTYSADRQPGLDTLLLNAARHTDARFVVAGSQYPERILWPENVQRIMHLPPPEHRRFYNQQRFTLNVTRAEMVRSGFSPSVRLFEAAACGTPVISDWWEGLDAFFTPGREILIARSTDDVLDYLSMDEAERVSVGEAARARALAEHSAARRAQTLEQYVLDLLATEQR